MRQIDFLPYFDGVERRGLYQSLRLHCGLTLSICGNWERMERTLTAEFLIKSSLKRVFICKNSETLEDTTFSKPDIIEVFQ